MKRIIIGLACLVATVAAHAQKKDKTTDAPEATPTSVRLQSFEQKKRMMDTSWVKDVPFRNVGPTVMSGRVTDIAVSPTDPTRFYVAYASGGLWRTVNNGQSFTPLFDHEATMTIGAIAVDWNHGETIWIGTGEVNSSRSSYAGVGIYKSIDTGKTWIYKGLPESQHIGRIIINPNDPNTLCVAVLGHLFSANADRGVYKTTDGGNNWKRVLYVDDNTGAVDLAINPVNAKVLYAAMWYRTRRAWDFKESGKTSGIYKSDDGGDTWRVISAEGKGFPVGDGVGRIGLSVSPVNPNVVYAILDNDFRKPKDTTKKVEDLTKDMLRTMSTDSFMKLDNKKIESYLRGNDFPKKYTAVSVKLSVKAGKVKPNDLVTYIEDANALLFDTPVRGAELYRSDDAGAHWHKTHDMYLDGMFNGYGYYFARVLAHPHELNTVYIIGFNTLKSTDSGKTFKSIMSGNVHVDCHTLWVDAYHNGHIILGNDGGLNLSYDDGAHWVRCNTPPVGQFYSVNVDNASPYNVYGGLQDNGVWFGSSKNTNNNDWQMDGQYPFKSIMGGDGMQVAMDTTNHLAYTGYQFGNYFKINLNSSSYHASYITPKHELGERPLRWNWQSPITLSKYNPEIIYFGSNKLYRSTNAGKSFDFASTDLTNGGKQGNVPYGTITAVDESPLRFGLIYAGTDDGNVWVSKDAANTFTKITTGLPPNLWVRRIYADVADEATIYVTLNGHTWDDFTPYIYVSHNYGSTWQRIGKDLPDEPVNVLKQDPNAPNVLYAGTDNGLYVSLNSGATFMPMMGGLPNVAVHDLVVQKKAHELVIGTHGRSIYIAYVKTIERLTDTVIAKPIYVLFGAPYVRDYEKDWGKRDEAWEQPNTPLQNIPLWVNKKTQVHYELALIDGPVLFKRDTVLSKGIHSIPYDFTVDTFQKTAYVQALKRDNKDSTAVKVTIAENHKLYLLPGKYIMTFTDSEGHTFKQSIEMKVPKEDEGGSDDDSMPMKEEE